MDPAIRELMDVARSVLGELDVDEVLERVLESARTLTGARYAALGVLAPDRRSLQRFLSLGIDAETIEEIGHEPQGLGVLGELTRHPVPLRLREVSEHPRSYGLPPGHPPMHTFLGVPIMVDGEPFGNLYLTEKAGGGEFTREDEEALVAFAGLAGLAIDHARRYTGSEFRRVELQQTVDALEATIEIARALAGQTEIDAILQLVAERGRALVGARLLVIEVQIGADLLIAAGAGALPPALIGSRMPVENTVASAALGTGRTQRLSDELMWARFHQHGIGRLGLDARDGLVVPMIFHGEPFGVLVALDHLAPEHNGEPRFSPAHERLLESFAASAAMAVATAQSAARERRRQVMAAAEAERGRWARELHDETLQAMGSVKLILAAARRDPDAAGMRARIEDAIGQLQADMDSLRALVADLRPGSLDQLGVEAALSDLIERVSATAEIEIDADIRLAYEQRDRPDRLAAELETAVYRTVQEALNNAVKHSGAARAIVEVLEQGDRVLVRVRDNGRGFDPAQPTSGFGLLGMRERVSLIGGTLTIESEPGGGTAIMAEFEVQRASQPHPSPAPLKALQRLVDA